MSACDVKQIVYHCQCRRFAEGTPVAPCICLECGREHVPTEEYGAPDESSLGRSHAFHNS